MNISIKEQLLKDNDKTPHSTALLGCTNEYLSSSSGANVLRAGCAIAPQKVISTRATNP